MSAAANRLRKAAREIESALILLNVREVKCDTCAARHFENPDEAKAYEALSDQPDKLRRAADRLEQGVASERLEKVGAR